MQRYGGSYVSWFSVRLFFALLKGSMLLYQGINRQSICVLYRFSHMFILPVWKTPIPAQLDAPYWCNSQPHSKKPLTVISFHPTFSAH